MMAPVWPSTPVSWVTSGMRRATNQVFTRRSTHTNVIASPDPDEGPRHEGEGVGVGEGEPGLREGERRETDEHDATGAEAVEHEAHRHLHPGIDQQLEHRERRQLGGGDVEPLRRREAGDCER